MFRNYNRPGKGVNKRDPNQSRVSIFFELLNRKKWDLLKVNVFYLITSIPTMACLMYLAGLFSSPATNFFIDIISKSNEFNNANVVNEALTFDMILRLSYSFLFLVFLGQGPTTAGITYILTNYAKEEHVWFFGDWWKHTKTNFRQALAICVIDILAVFSFVTAINYYSNISGGFVIKYLLQCGAFIYLLAHMYIYQLIITFKNSLLNSFKNAVILSIQKGPQNLLILFIQLIIYLVLPLLSVILEWNFVFWMVYVAAQIFVLPALTGFMVNFFIYPQIEKYIE